MRFQTKTIHAIAGVIAIFTLVGCSKPQDSDSAQAPASAPVSVASESARGLDPVLLKAMPEPYQTADIVNGAKQFNKCRSCHTLEKGGMNLVGPNLNTVFGRKAGTLAGYNYSDAMKAHKAIWDFDTLDPYLKAPQDVVKGTKMGFMGVKSDTDRRDLIAYLRAYTMDKK